MLTTILDQVSRLVGQGHIISAFVPWFLFCFANIVTFAVIIGPASALRLWHGEIASSAGATAVMSLVVFLLLIVGAYLVASLNGFFKRFLEGRYLGPPLGPLMRWKRERKRVRLGKLEREANTIAEELGKAREFVTEIHKTIPSLYSSGRLDNAGKILPSDSGDRYRRELSGLVKDDKGLGALKQAAVTLETLYRQFDPQQFESYQVRLYLAAEKFVKHKETMLSALVEAREKSFASLAVVAPTDYGNILAAANQYAASRYGIESIVFWSRLQQVIPKRYMEIVRDAKTLMDFLTAVTLLSIVYSILWFLLLPYLVETVLTLFCVTTGGLLAGWLFYTAAAEAASSFGELFRSCFDLFRHKLLRQFGLPLPPNLKVEKELWTRLSKFVLYDEPLDLEFAKSAPPIPAIAPNPRLE